MDEAVVEPLVRTREIIRRRMVDLQRAMARLKRPSSSASGAKGVHAGNNAYPAVTPDAPSHSPQAPVQSSVVQGGGSGVPFNGMPTVTSDCDVFSSVISRQSSGGVGRLPAQPCLLPANRRYKDARVVCEGSQSMPWRIVDPAAGCESADSEGDAKALSSAFRASEKKLESVTSPGVEMLDLAPPAAGTISSSINTGESTLKVSEDGASRKEAIQSQPKAEQRIVPQDPSSLEAALGGNFGDPVKSLTRSPAPDAQESEEAVLLSEADQNWILSEAQWEDDNTLPAQPLQEDVQVDDADSPSQGAGEWPMDDDEFPSVLKPSEAADDAQ